MKLLLCEKCFDLVVPSSRPQTVRWCKCRCACCWWDDPDRGKFACSAIDGAYAVSVLGLHNGLLTEPFHTHRSDETHGGNVERPLIPGQTIRRIIAETPSSYLFKTLETLIVRFRAGYSNDTRFVEMANIPPSEELTQYVQRARQGPPCSECGGTGVMRGDPDAPADSIRRVDVPCPYCQEV